jgi:hypothetical protein
MNFIYSCVTFMYSCVTFISTTWYLVQGRLFARHEFVIAAALNSARRDTASTAVCETVVITYVMTQRDDSKHYEIPHLVLQCNRY